MRRLLAAPLTVELLAFGASSATGQENLSPALQTNLAEATTEGDQALIYAVAVAVEEKPDLAQAIIDEAILLNRRLEQSVFGTITVDDKVQSAAAEESLSIDGRNYCKTGNT